MVAVVYAQPFLLLLATPSTPISQLLLPPLIMLTVHSIAITTIRLISRVSIPVPIPIKESTRIPARTSTGRRTKSRTDRKNRTPKKRRNSMEKLSRPSTFLDQSRSLKLRLEMSARSKPVARTPLGRKSAENSPELPMHRQMLTKLQANLNIQCSLAHPVAAQPEVPAIEFYKMQVSDP